MSVRVDNAVILAAGTSSRFAPLSYERPKALIEVRGEVLIERQIRQLRERGIQEIILVTGYKAEQFAYLEEKFGVELVENPEYLTRNNNSSIYAVRDRLRNTYLCSSDNYFARNPFEAEVDGAYYAGVYADGPTNEWCIQSDAEGTITDVHIGGDHSWYMLGHTFWDEAFSRRFVAILEACYHEEQTAGLLWESIYLQHLDELKMKLRKYPNDMIFEFDTLDELRVFDPSYVSDTRSQILARTAAALHCLECDITSIKAYKDANAAAAGFTFQAAGNSYQYSYTDQQVRRLTP